VHRYLASYAAAGAALPAKLLAQSNALFAKAAAAAAGSREHEQRYACEAWQCCRRLARGSRGTRALPDRAWHACIPHLAAQAQRLPAETTESRSVVRASTAVARPRLAAFLADAAALARAQWTQFSPAAMLAGLGVFAASLLLQLRCAAAAALHGAEPPRAKGACASTAAASQHAGRSCAEPCAACAQPMGTQPAPQASPAEGPLAPGAPAIPSGASSAWALLSGMHGVALAAALACAGAVFSANAVMAEGYLAAGAVALLGLALAGPPAARAHAPPPAGPGRPHSRAGARPAARPGRPLPGSELVMGRAARGAVGPALGVAAAAALAAAAGVVARTPNDAMHKAAAGSAHGAWQGAAAALAAPLGASAPAMLPALRAALHALPVAGAYLLVRQLQAHFMAGGAAGDHGAACVTRRHLRRAAGAATRAAYACAGLHLALVGPHGSQSARSAAAAAAPRACVWPLLAALQPLARALGAAAQRWAPGIHMRLAGAQAPGSAVLLPRLVFANSAAALALTACASGLPRARAPRSLPGAAAAAGGPCGKAVRHAAPPCEAEQVCQRPGPMPSACTSPDVADLPEPGPALLVPDTGAAAVGRLLTGCMAALLPPAAVVLGTAAMPAAGLGLLEAACAWACIRAGPPLRRTPWQERSRASVAGVLWALLGTQLFFCTGHFCEFAGLQTAAGERAASVFAPRVGDMPDCTVVQSDAATCQPPGDSCMHRMRARSTTRMSWARRVCRADGVWLLAVGRAAGAQHVRRAPAERAVAAAAIPAAARWGLGRPGAARGRAWRTGALGGCSELKHMPPPCLMPFCTRFSIFRKASSLALGAVT